jgi:hypothetical protein
MDYTISSCFVKSDEHTSHPNGELTARGFVSYFDNKNIGKYDPVKVEKIEITNSNGVSFFKRDNSISVSALRAIAASLIDIAQKAEKASARMIEVNKNA